MYALFIELNALFYICFFINAFLLEKMPLEYACTQLGFFYKHYRLKWVNEWMNEWMNDAFI